MKTQYTFYIIDPKWNAVFERLFSATKFYLTIFLHLPFYNKIINIFLEMITDFLIQWILFTALIFDASMAWFVLLKNPKRSINQAYWLFMTAVCLWQLSNFLFSYYHFESAYSTSIILSITYPIAGLATYLAWYFVTLFPEQKHKPKQLFFLVILWILAALIISNTTWLVELTHFDNANKHIFEYHWLYGIFIAVISIGICLIFLTLKKKYTHAAHEREKIQLQYLLIGFTLFTCIGFVANIITPIIRNIILGISSAEGVLFYNIGPASSIFLSTFFGYAILRHRLLDIKIILQRKWFSFISAAIVLFIIVSIIATNSTMLTTLIAMMSAGILFVPLQKSIALLIHKFIKKEIIDLFKITDLEKEFLKTCNRPDAFFRTLSHQMMQRIPLEKIHGIIYDPVARYYTTAFALDAFPHLGNTFNRNEQWIEVLRRVPKIIEIEKIDACQEFTKKEKDTLKKYCTEKEIQMLIPLYDRNELLGLFIIGNRIDQQPFTYEDREYMKDIQLNGNQLVYAILTLYHTVTTRLDDTARVTELLQRKTAKKD